MGRGDTVPIDVVDGTGSPTPEGTRLLNWPGLFNREWREFWANQSGSEANCHGWFRTPVDLSQNRERRAPLGNRRKPLPQRQETQNAERFWLSAMGVNQLGGQFRNEKISSLCPTLFEQQLS